MGSWDLGLRPSARPSELLETTGSTFSCFSSGSSGPERGRSAQGHTACQPPPILGQSPPCLPLRTVHPRRPPEQESAPNPMGFAQTAGDMDPTGACGTGGGPLSSSPSPITVLHPQPGNHSLPGWERKGPVAATGKEAHHPHTGSVPWRRPGKEPVHLRRSLAGRRETGSRNDRPADSQGDGAWCLTSPGLYFLIYK